ncbi:MAG: family 43 glycosylhydrolase [Candidatus Lokiarchaeota archaeon]|nr:family 43 glycosylhydrolase [Candidatus Lokiarchaeota archaeon]
MVGNFSIYLLFLIAMFVYSLITPVNTYGETGIGLDEIQIRDPNIFVYGDKYYLTGTTHEYGFLGYSSDDLINWQSHGLIYQRNTSNYWASYHFWAPEIAIRNDKFYMFFTAKNDTTHRATGVAVADSPMGPYKDICEDPLTPQEYDCLDGHLYDAENGSEYLIYVNEWIQDGVEGIGEMWIQEINSDYTKLLGEPTKLFQGYDAEWSNAVIDGPSMLKYNGIYYLFWTSFGPDEGYNVGYAYSDNLHKNYQQSSDPFIGYESGHTTWFRDKDTNELLITFHHPNYDPERCRITQLIWDENKSSWKTEPEYFKRRNIAGYSVNIGLIIIFGYISMCYILYRISHSLPTDER